MARKRKRDYFDAAGTPSIDPNAYALEIAGDSMLPVYREGDIVIVSPSTSVRNSDRVIAKTKDGKVVAKILQHQTSHTVELASFNPAHESKIYAMKEIDWIARILWASQ
jgi:phage repressor protein C with HTH and peptisase S24 domain